MKLRSPRIQTLNLADWTRELWTVKLPYLKDYCAITSPPINHQSKIDNLDIMKGTKEHVARLRQSLLSTLSLSAARNVNGQQIADFRLGRNAREGWTGRMWMRMKWIPVFKKWTLSCDCRKYLQYRLQTYSRYLYIFRYVPPKSGGLKIYWSVIIFLFWIHV